MTTATAPTIGLDETFDALGHEKRRLLLHDLTKTKRRPMTDAITEPEMIHNHLPRLADYGIIEWDRGEGVRRGPNFEEVKPFLEKALSRR